jgi:hypothetical protein
MEFPAQPANPLFLVGQLSFTFSQEVTSIEMKGTPQDNVREKETGATTASQRHSRHGAEARACLKVDS